MQSGQQQVAVVTGSSSGIGFETSLLLARNGIYTYATMRNQNKSDDILAYARNNNLPLKTLYLDVTNEKSILECIKKIIAEKGRIDILVNNAGYLLLGPLEQLQINEIKEEFETNFFGIIKLIQSVLPIMRKQRYGKIINISSLAGRIGFPLSSAYVSSKFALEGLTESLGYEVRNFGIHIVLIEPGVIRTNFLNSMKLGKNVSMPQNDNNIDSPYSELIQKRVSAFKPRFEKGSSPIEVAKIILEAVTSHDPKPRYLVGYDAIKMMEKRKDTTDKEFIRFVMDSVLGRDS
ncbi:MAG TPA: SDR family oxidoreductase [Nitrososphaeraceae archaeon]|jgi:NAD(P)-dependent dehydrogenase (short-subunit alcohol dehydrogenase family)|nr:SDR family oxidoreductase [Nitrososphaeraceae archaeon]